MKIREELRMAMYFLTALISFMAISFQNSLASETVVNDTSIVSEGKHTSLSNAALIAIRRLGYDWKAIQGALYWVYEGETLLERRDWLEQARSEQYSNAASAKDQPETLRIKTFTCKSNWGVDGCKPHIMDVQLYVPNSSQPIALVILQHGSGGVTSAVQNKISLLNKNNYAVVVIDSFTSRGIKKSHFDYSGTSLNGGNARTMALDSLSVIEALKNDNRINIKKSAIVGFSQGGSVGYWIKSQTFLDTHASLLLGKYEIPKVIVAFYGCHGEFNESFNFNSMPVEIIIGDKDPILRKCDEFKKRLPTSQSSEIRITTLPRSYHSFDENFPLTNWVKNQNTNDCYIILKRDSSAENPILGISYSKGQYSYSKAAKDCTKMGELAGNSGDVNIGNQSLLATLKKYLD